MSGSPSSIQMDLDYVKSPPGILKIVEFVLLMIAFACLADINGSGSRYHFFLFVTVTLWLMVIFLFVLFITKLYEKVNAPWVILMIMFSGVACLGLLIASSLIADSAADAHKAIRTLENYYGRSISCSSCGNLDAAAAFGFFSLVAFALDCAFYVWKFTKNQSSDQPAPAKVNNEPDQFKDSPERFP